MIFIDTTSISDTVLVVLPSLANDVSEEHLQIWKQWHACPSTSVTFGADERNARDAAIHRVTETGTIHTTCIWTELSCPMCIPLWTNLSLPTFSSSSQLLLTVSRANLTIGQCAFCHSSNSLVLISHCYHVIHCSMACLIHKVQSVQNATVRLVTNYFWF